MLLDPTDYRLSTQLVHLSNIRLHLNAWHTSRRYQNRRKTTCVFCQKEGTEDSIEHIFFCERVQGILPCQLKTGAPARVPVSTWMLLHVEKPEKLLMSLYVRAIHSIHNAYRHNHEYNMDSHALDHGEFKHAVHHIILDTPLRPQLSKYVTHVLKRT